MMSKKVESVWDTRVATERPPARSRPSFPWQVQPAEPTEPDLENASAQPSPTEQSATHPVQEIQSESSQFSTKDEQSYKATPTRESSKAKPPLGDRGGHRGTVPQRANVRADIAPNSDFNKRANSLERDALPAGWFPGTSKKVYDALYIRTRGAMHPTRSLVATKKEIAVWSGIINRKTLDNHMRVLEANGLIKRHWELGDNSGYKYEVNLPEELKTLRQNTPPLSPSDPLTPSPQKRDRGSDPFLEGGSDPKRVRGGQSQVLLETTAYGTPNTVKTIKTNDDEENAAFGEMNQVLADAVRNLTGKETSAADAARWREVGEMLVAELKRAAGNAGSITSPAAFLVAHLERSFRQKPVRESRKSKAAERRDEVGKTIEREEIANSRLPQPELDMRVEIFEKMLREGDTLERLAKQFEQSIHPEDWQEVLRRLVLEQTRIASDVTTDNVS